MGWQGPVQWGRASWLKESGAKGGHPSTKGIPRLDPLLQRVLNHDVGMSEAGDANAAFSSPVSAGLKMGQRTSPADSCTKPMASASNEMPSRDLKTCRDGRSHHIPCRAIRWLNVNHL
ncbi:unnamed protein product [Eretmochelys imbricata]